MCIVIAFCPGCDVINFEISLIFLIKLFFLHEQKINTKISICVERKELHEMKGTFHHFERPLIEGNKIFVFGS